jgi:hypothetical protein
VKSNRADVGDTIREKAEKSKCDASIKARLHDKFDETWQYLTSSKCLPANGNVGLASYGSANQLRAA